MGNCIRNCITDCKLRNCDDNVEPITFTFTRCKCVAVYDGDTCKVVGIRRGEKVKVTIRLHGIDSPEIRTKDPDEKVAAIKARDVLRTRILNKMINVRFVCADKYHGREVAILSDREGEINSWMISSNHAVPYDGGKKSKFGERVE